MAERLVEAVARVISAAFHKDFGYAEGDGAEDWSAFEGEARAVLAMPELAAALRLAEATLHRVEIGNTGLSFLERDIRQFDAALTAYRATRGEPR
jgi:catechol 2,3-dioxygenase-like lactoylglutathione lyase family enzyme